MDERHTSKKSVYWDITLPAPIVSAVSWWFFMEEYVGLSVLVSTSSIRFNYCGLIRLNFCHLENMSIVSYRLEKAQWVLSTLCKNVTSDTILSKSTLSNSTSNMARSISTLKSILLTWFRHSSRYFSCSSCLWKFTLEYMKTVLQQESRPTAAVIFFADTTPSSHFRFQIPFTALQFSNLWG